MSSNLSENQKDALERAAECRRKAEAAEFEALRADYLEMEQRWLRLAESPPTADSTLPERHLPKAATVHRPGDVHATGRSMLAKIRDLHQSLSWNAGYGSGKEGRPFNCPWWVNQIVFSSGYMKGKSDRIDRSNKRRSSR